MKITLFGKGAHGSRPRISIDPVVMAAATVMRLQTVVSREVAGTDTAVVTAVGAMRAGTKEKIIPDNAELLVSIRTVNGGVRSRVLDAIEPLSVRAEAAASGATRDPQVQLAGSLPAVVNGEPSAVAHRFTRAAAISVCDSTSRSPAEPSSGQNANVRPSSAVLFDFDGTLLDTESTVLTTWREEYGRHGLELAEDVWLATIGTDSDRYAILADLAGPAFDKERCRIRKRARETELVSALGLREGITECIAEAARAGIRLGIVSGSPADWVLPHLHRLALRDQFDVVVTRESARRAKPYPDLYLAALGRLGVPAALAVAVEDSRHGVAAALAAGIRCVAFPNCVTRRQDLSHADAVANAAELSSYVLKLKAAG